MSQDEIRFRFSRNVAVDSALGQMAKYISSFASQRGRTQSDLLFELVCARYLPFGFQDLTSVSSRIEAIRSIYFLESSIQEILTFYGMDDPRPKSAQAAHAASLNPEAYLGEHEALHSLESDDEPEDAEDSSDSSQGIQSTVNRMMI